MFVLVGGMLSGFQETGYILSHAGKAQHYVNAYDITEILTYRRMAKHAYQFLLYGQISCLLIS
jgi:hypothetical protein